MSQNEQRFSNKTGEEYDLFSLVLPHQDEIQKKTVEKIINHLTDKKPLNVLEIGFGTGITTHEILSKIENIDLTAIDNEPKMLEKALGKLKFFPPSRFNLQTIDALEYLKQQESNTFDDIISVWVLHNIHADIRIEIYKEIYRVLKPGGIFINGDKLAVADKSLHQEHLDWQLKQFDKFENIGRPELKKEWTDHYIEDEDVNRILYEDVFIKDLENIGFKDCSLDNRNFMDAVGYGVKS